MKDLAHLFVDHWIELPDEEFTKPINYVMAQNGCFEIRDTSIGRATVRTEECPGLQTRLTENVELSIPPIPGALLTTILDFFRAVYREKQQAEAFLQIFLNQEDGTYFLYCPPQQVSGALVRFVRNPELESQHLLVMDIHSHNSMPAFFSGIDDDDEKEDRLYGVIGCVHQSIPHLEFRMGVAGRFIPLDGRDLFDGPALPNTWPQAWLDRCYTSRTPRHSRPGSSFSNRSYSGRSFSGHTMRYRRDERWGEEWEAVFMKAGDWHEEPVFVPKAKKLPRGWSI